MTTKRINHGDVVGFRFTVLTTRHDPEVVVLVPSAYDDVVERENTYFLRRHPDGQLCTGHQHETTYDARPCDDRTKLSALWQGFVDILADASRRLNAEYADYRKGGGSLSGEDWLAQRNKKL
jgi:hypothetical protein